MQVAVRAGGCELGSAVSAPSIAMFCSLSSLAEPFLLPLTPAFPFALSLLLLSLSRFSSSLASTASGHSPRNQPWWIHAATTSESSV